MTLRYIATALALFAGSAAPSWAQDEIIVTATRMDASVPGTFLEVQGDFLLVEITVYNDSRDIETRGEEITETLENLAQAAERNRDIELSLRIEDEIVRPFTLKAAIDAVTSGSQPQTSRVTLLAKTPIPSKVTNSYALVTKLQSFAEDVETVGRTSVFTDEEPNVSVEDPDQYRPQLITAVTDEIKAITSALGGNYRVILQDIDEEMKYVRGSDLSLIFYIPYDYEIIPTSLTSRDVITLPEDY